MAGTTTATAWNDTATDEPPDGAPIEWPSADGVIVRGYRMGRAGRGLWVEPTKDGPRYHGRPKQWRPAEGFERRGWL